MHFPFFSLQKQNTPLAALRAGTMAYTKPKHRQRYSSLKRDLLISLEDTSRSFSSFKIHELLKNGACCHKHKESLLDKGDYLLASYQTTAPKHELFKKAEVFLKKSRTVCFAALHFQKVANFIWYLQGKSTGEAFGCLLGVFFLLEWLQFSAAEKGTL